MKSALPKVLHRAAGLPLIDHVLAAARSLGPASVVVIIGHQTEQLRAHLADGRTSQLALQEPQLGPGMRCCRRNPS